MAIDEKAMNGYIAAAMEKQAPPDWRVEAEQHGLARRGSTSPDIVVYMPYGLRTIVETEYRNPAITDAKARLGYEFGNYNLPMKSVIAVGIPERLGNMRHTERDKELVSNEPQFYMQVVTGKSKDDPHIKITPDKPVLASLRDIVQYAWLSAIPEPYAANVVSEVVGKLKAAKTALSQRLVTINEEVQSALVRLYGNHDSANGMESVAGNVTGTLASMIQLHMNLKEWGNVPEARSIGDPELWQRIEPNDGIPSRIAAEWRKIEKVNWVPLSTIAAEMLEHSELGPRLGRTLRTVYETMSEYIRAGISATTNVSAEIWQALIPDRDERAAYYTKPITAEILANMTTARLAVLKEAKYNEICAGTGTLARATEENIRFRYYAETEEKASIHAERMQRCIQLTDINPQSISVAVASLTSLEPQTRFDSTAMFAITANGGSLNFLKREGVSNMQNLLIGRNGAQGEMLTIIPRVVGICCNNDPYFRPRGGAKSPISSKDMQSYKRRADRLVKDVAHGQAGLATFMHVIEHQMLGHGCPHGKVLPLTAAHAETYTGFRRNIENEYCDVIAISTASGDGASMSADTGIQEMLLVATKHLGPQNSPQQLQNGDRAVTCVNLNTTFETRLEAKMFADGIRREVALGKPNGQITTGSVIGTYYRMTNLGEGKPWSALGTSGDYTVLTDAVTKGTAWNPATGQTTAIALPMTTLSGVSGKGPTHHLLGCLPASRDPRGAFTMYPKTETQSHNNPSLWELQAGQQTKISCEPTHYGEPRGDAEEAERMLETAGHFHLSRNLRMSAQKIAVAYTETKCMGGRSWTTINAEESVTKAVALFLNSTYGLLIRIGYGQSTDLGRSPIQVRAIDNHPIPDFASESDAGKKARKIAAENFERIRNLSLERISLCVIDPNRQEIDRVVTLMLGLPVGRETQDMLALWRRLMCLQPAVNANNKETLATLSEAGITG